ncbi:hypothetical protein J2Z65_005124 [Paenibacillus aceris]|uniref:Uncharacterized protein n=1 Tax=Paenibacillus aceris TaxID=869555 RepID=A0ABS4I4Q2_9BACL|nr:hypothetical protein [Paenibacillus aceris]
MKSGDLEVCNTEENNLGGLHKFPYLYKIIALLLFEPW